MRINEGKLPRIVGVKAAGEFRLRLRFANGKSFAVDLSRDVRGFKPYRPLLDQALFARVALGEGGHSVTWPVEELDMGADTLWQYALDQNGRQDAAEFIRWRWRNRLSLTAAAEALGLSRRQIAYYASGEHQVPRTVLLACKGWESERRHAAA
jgi:Protein of unknown function (DUF2442)